MKVPWVIFSVMLLWSTASFAFDLHKLEQGEVDVQIIHHSDSPIKELRAVALIKAPVEKVWQVLTDYPNYPKFLARVTQAEVRKQHGNIQEVYMKLDVPWPLPNTWYLNRYHLDPIHHRVSWYMLKGSIKDNKGSWQLRPYKKNYTLATYKVVVDPGVPFVPHWVIYHVTKRTVPEVFYGLQRYLK